MRKKTIAEKIEINGKMLPINTHGEGKGCYVEMLIALEREMTAMLSNDRKVLMFRFDIHINKYTHDNKVISKLLIDVKRFINRKYPDAKRVGHIWCREQQTVKHQHYHVFMMVNGSKIETSYKIFKEIQRLADNSPLLTEPHIPKNAYTMVKRGDDDAYNEAFYRASYLAKERTKGYKGTKGILDRVNNYNATNIKPRLNEHGNIFTAGDDYMKRIKAKVSSNKIDIPDAIKAPLPPTDNIVKKQLTDAERQLSLF